MFYVDFFKIRSSAKVQSDPSISSIAFLNKQTHHNKKLPNTEIYLR